MLAFATGLLHRGEVVLRGRPRALAGEAPEEPELASVLERAFARHALDVAGAPIAFDAAVARRAAAFVELACWLLVQPGAPREPLATHAGKQGMPRTASDHLSADLFLRYLPVVLRRARALDPVDPLGAEVARVLRRFPLSGVLAGLDEGPEGALDLGGHEGLALLYAERLAARESRAWAPREGLAREQLERVLAGLGRQGSALLASRVEAVGPGHEVDAAPEDDDADGDDEEEERDEASDE